MVEANAKFQYHASDKLPVYVDPEQKSDMHNVRLRHNRVDNPRIKIINKYSSLFFYSQIPRQKQHHN